MKLAKSTEGQWIKASDAVTGKEYICPHCGKILRCRTTKYGKSFYHHHSSPSYHTNESRLHQKLKQWIYCLASEHYRCTMEKQCGKQWADVFVYPKTVYEIQLSVLSRTTIFQRHQDYQAQGLYDVWLLGGNNMKRHRYYDYLRYHPQLGYYFFEIKEQALYLHYNLSNINKTEKIKKYTTWPKSFPQKAPFPPLNAIPLFYSKVNRYCHQKTKGVYQLQNLCYLHGTTLYYWLPYLSLPVYTPFSSLYDELYYKLLFLLKEPFTISHPFCQTRLTDSFINEYHKQCQILGQSLLNNKGQ